MSEPTPQQRQLLSPRTTWVLWAMMQGNLVVALGVVLVLNRFVTAERVTSAWFGVALANLAFLLEAGGFWAYVRSVVLPPGERNRAALRTRDKLLAAGSPGGGDATALDAVAALVGEFRSCSVIAWALLEAGALLAAIGIYLAGPQSVLLLVLPLWFAAALYARPTAARTETFAFMRLRAAGLTEEQARTLWTRALELVRARPN